MLWRTHIRIANEILSELGISKSSFEASRMREGVVAPDKWKDFPHHHGKSDKIGKYIMNARNSFLSDDVAGTCFHLGVALHYIQDSYVSLSTRSEHHTRWEEQMDQAYITDNLQQLVQRAFQERPSRREEYMKLAEILSSKIEGKEATLRLATMPGPGLSSWGHREWGKPHVDVNFASKASYLISKSVFAPKNYLKLQEKLKHTLQEYEEKLKKAEIDFANSIMELIEKRDGLERRKRKNGFLQTVRSWFLTLLGMKGEFQAKRKLNRYKKQMHLKEVLREYKKAVEDAVAPHRYWYSFDIPRVNVSDVKRELLSIQEASEHLRVEENIVRELVDKNKISCYCVKDDELVCRSELKKALGN